MLWLIGQFLLLKFELLRDLRLRYWSLSGQALPVEGGGEGASFLISMLPFPSCSKEPIDPVPEILWMKPWPRAEFRLSIKIFSGHGFPRVVLIAAYNVSTVVFGSGSSVSQLVRSRISA
jgi:hypothetical protein